MSPSRDDMARIRNAALDRGLEWNDSWFFRRSRRGGVMRLTTQLMVAELTKFAASGFTLAETADEAGMSYAAIAGYARKHNIKFRRPAESIPSERSGTDGRAVQVWQNTRANRRRVRESRESAFARS